VRGALARRVGRFLGVTELFRAVWALRDTQIAIQDGWIELATELGHLVQTVNILTYQLEDLERSVTVATAVQLADVPEQVVSVILPTRNRAALLHRAIQSVLDQSHEHWQLVVVDDGSDDETSTALEQVSDPRVCILRQDHSGDGAARNAGLAAASGEYVAYLDDDNVMHPDWLRAIVWAFNQNPGARVVIGSRIVDNWARVVGPGTQTGPRAQRPFFDRDHIARAPLADIGMVAHRRGLPEARFDESLTAAGDWEFLYRLTEDHDPCLVQAVACLYTSTAPNRISDSGDVTSNVARVLDKIRVRQRSHDSSSPQPASSSEEP
jgi:hypothetical protein